MSRLSDVAARAGVSEATVSRVLNDRPGVSEQTRRAVQAAVDMMGYQRPTGLRPDVDRAVALVVPDFTNPWFIHLAQLTRDRLAAHGYATVVRSSHRLAGGDEQRFVPTLMSSRVAGVVFLGGDYQDCDRDHNHYATLLERGLPTVMVNGAGVDLGFRTVSTDEAVAARLAWQHLWQLGHEDIGLIVGHHGHLGSRLYVQTVTELSTHIGKGLSRRNVIYTDSRLETGQAAAAELISAGATALICANDHLAMGAYRAVRRAGLELGSGCAVVGHDGAPWSQLVSPTLTTVRQPAELLAAGAVEALVVGGSVQQPTNQLFVPELLLGESTAQRA